MESSSEDSLEADVFKNFLQAGYALIHILLLAPQHMGN